MHRDVRVAADRPEARTVLSADVTTAAVCLALELSLCQLEKVIEIVNFLDAH
jgi:hypothetical protein